MKIFTLLFLISIISSCTGQQQYTGDFPAFKNYIFNIVEDSTNSWSEYPTPPKVTDSVLFGMQKEIMADDSSRYYLEQLSVKNYKGAVDYENAFKYIDRMDYGYSLLALTAHWNPDLRVYALVHLNKKLTIRTLVNSRKMKNGEWERYDKVAVEFLVYLLESNPLFVSGSENATIHGNYISNILRNLDLLTGENIMENKDFRDWYINDLQFETAVLKWKAHIK
ncbi:MAG: hypothetical protein AB9834_14460 [Lentimicrobium sp.]